ARGESPKAPGVPARLMRPGSMGSPPGGNLLPRGCLISSRYVNQAACPGYPPLTIEGEQIWPVPPLACEGIAPPASRLFVARPRAVAPDLALGADDPVVSEICRRLDGIPLAIELAAARVRSLGPAQIRDRLDERFRLLTGGARHGVERHQALRRAIQWS